MSKENPQEHLKTYETFCAPRFTTIEGNIKDCSKAINDLNVIITNGLQQRVEGLEKSNRRVIRLLASLLLVIIASTIALLWRGGT